MSFLMDKSNPHDLYYESEEEKNNRLMRKKDFEEFQQQTKREREQILNFSQELTKVVTQLQTEVKELRISNAVLQKEVKSLSRKYPAVNPNYVTFIVGLVSKSVGANWIAIASACYIVVLNDYTIYLLRKQLPSNVSSTLIWSLALYFTYAIYTAYSNFTIFSTRVASTVQIQSVSLTMNIVNTVGTFFAEVALDAKTKYETSDVLQDAISLGKRMFDIINSLVGEKTVSLQDNIVSSSEDLYNTTVLVPVIKNAISNQLTSDAHDMKINDFVSTALTLIIESEKKVSDSVALVDYGKMITVNQDLFDGEHPNQAIAKIVDGMTRGLTAISENSSVMKKAMPLEKINKLKEDLTVIMKKGSSDIERKIDSLKKEGGEYIRTSVPGADYIVPLYQKFNLCDERGMITGSDRSCTLYLYKSDASQSAVTVSVEANFLLLYVLLTNLTWQPIRAAGFLAGSVRRLYLKGKSLGGYVSKRLGLSEKSDDFLIETLPGYLRMRKGRSSRKTSRGGKSSRPRKGSSTKRSRRR